MTDDSRFLSLFWSVPWNSSFVITNSTGWLISSHLAQPSSWSFPHSYSCYWTSQLTSWHLYASSRSDPGLGEVCDSWLCCKPTSCQQLLLALLAKHTQKGTLSHLYTAHVHTPLTAVELQEVLNYFLCSSSWPLQCFSKVQVRANGLNMSHHFTLLLKLLTWRWHLTNMTQSLLSKSLEQLKSMPTKYTLWTRSVPTLMDNHSTPVCLQFPAISSTTLRTVTQFSVNIFLLIGYSSHKLISGSFHLNYFPLFGSGLDSNISSCALTGLAQSQLILFFRTVLTIHCLLHLQMSIYIIFFYFWEDCCWDFI